MPTQTHRLFRAEVAKLKAGAADDQTIYDTLAAFMDRHGVPAMLAQEYRDEPAIVRLFAERGVHLLTEDDRAALDAGTKTVSDVLQERRP